MKTLDEYQKAVKKIAQEFNFNWTTYVQFIHLVEEVAEFGEALTVFNGDRKAGEGKAALADHSDIEEELGDILFSVLELSNKLNLDTSIVLEKALKRYEGKLEKLRKKTGTR